MLLYTPFDNAGHVDPAMRRLPLCTGALVALLLLPLPSGAVRVEDLYRAEVEVVDKGREARTEGFRAALEQVVVKVAGSSRVLSDPALEPLLENPARFVQQYRYERLEPDPDAGDAEPAQAETTAEDGEAPPPPPAYRLEVRFGQSQVERALREREITVWGPYRPQVLVWLAYDDGRQRALVAADDERDTDEVVLEAARRRGLPLLLPLLDTEDRGRVDYLDVQGGFLDSVRQASERYRAGLVLVGHVYRGSDGWRGEWTLLQADGRRGWLTRADSAEATVEAGVGGLADRLAAELAGREGERSRVRMRVIDTESLEDYARLRRYIERLPRVEWGRVVRVRPQEILFELQLRGELADLERAIGVGDLLVRVQEPAAGGLEPGRPESDPAAVPGSAATTDDGGAAPGPGAAATAATEPAGAGQDAAGPAGGDGGDGSDGGERAPIGGTNELVYRLVG